MAAEVNLEVRTQLGKIADDLKRISEAGKDAEEGMQNFGKRIGKTHADGLKKTEQNLSFLRTTSARVLKGIADDFRAMMAAVGISEGLRLGGMFRASIKESFELSDTIRKLGSVFNIAERNFGTFQTAITRGLGEIGLGADTAVNALRGLAETQVRGEAELVQYSRAAGQLASITGQRGQEGEIAQGVARVITAQGADPNDIARMEGVVNSLQKAFNATGQVPTKILQALEQVIATMPQDMRKGIQTSGLVNLGTIAAVGGPGATKFLEEYLGKSPVARKALEARGFGDVFGPEGLDIEKFKQAAQGVMAAFPDDPRLMAQTLDLTVDAAEGFVRLYESLDRVEKAQRDMRDDTKRLTDQYHEAMGASEAFRASLNKVKATFAEETAAITGFVTTGLRDAYQLTLQDVLDMLPKSLREGLSPVREVVPEALDESLGATATVAGAGLLATMLTGGGLRGILNLGRGKATGIAEQVAYEQATGQRVQPVYVVNATEIGMAGGAGGQAENLGRLSKLGGIAGLLGRAGMVGAAGLAGYGVGTIFNEAIKGTALDKAIDRLLQPLFESMTGTEAEPSEIFAKPGGAPIMKKKGQIDLSESVPTGVRTGVVRQKPTTIDLTGMAPANLRTGETQPTRRTAQDLYPPQKVDVRVRVDVATKNKDLKATARPGRGGAQ